MSEKFGDRMDFFSRYYVIPQRGPVTARPCPSDLDGDTVLFRRPSLIQREGWEGE
jgi:hypothetical protein